jgi:hypothetical protein
MHRDRNYWALRVRTHEWAEHQLVSLLDVDGIGKGISRALWKLGVTTATILTEADPEELARRVQPHRQHQRRLPRVRHDRRSYNHQEHVNPISRIWPRIESTMARHERATWRPRGKSCWSVCAQSAAGRVAKPADHVRYSARQSSALIKRFQTIRAR